MVASYRPPPHHLHTQPPGSKILNCPSAARPSGVATASSQAAASRAGSVSSSRSASASQSASSGLNWPTADYTALAPIQIYLHFSQHFFSTANFGFLAMVGPPDAKKPKFAVRQAAPRYKRGSSKCTCVSFKLYVNFKTISARGQQTRQKLLISQVHASCAAHGPT